jgi:hypothetical protein
MFYGLPDPHPDPLVILIGTDPHMDPYQDPYQFVTESQHWIIEPCFSVKEKQRFNLRHPFASYYHESSACVPPPLTIKRLSEQQSSLIWYQLPTTPISNNACKDSDP